MSDERVIEAVRTGDVVTLHGLPDVTSFHVENVAGPCWILRRQLGPGAGAAEASIHVAHVIRWKADTWVHVDGRTHVIKRIARGGSGGSRSDGDGTLLAPMTGKIVEVAARVGDNVKAGTLIVALSAMKMRVELKAPFAGIVTRLVARDGEQVEGGTLLALIERAALPAGSE